jgi:hypothetical protein
MNFVFALFIVIFSSNYIFGAAVNKDNFVDIKFLNQEIRQNGSGRLCSENPLIPNSTSDYGEIVDFFSLYV